VVRRWFSVVRRRWLVVGWIKLYPSQPRQDHYAERGERVIVFHPNTGIQGSSVILF